MVFVCEALGNVLNKEGRVFVTQNVYVGYIKLL